MSANDTSEQEGGYEPRLTKTETSIHCRIATHRSVPPPLDVEHRLRLLAINAGFLVDEITTKHDRDGEWHMIESVAKVRKV